MKLTFKQHHRQTMIETDGSTSVLSLARAAGIFIDAPCSGVGKCGKCKVVASGNFGAPSAQERALLTPQEIDRGMRLACMTYPIGDGMITLLQDNRMDQKGAPSQQSFVQKPMRLGAPDHSIGMAVDIGTTTVVAYFYDLHTGQRIHTESALNHQRAYGADVISRIAYCGAHSAGLQTLQQTIIDQLNGFITAFTDATGHPSYEILDVSIAANTTMLHLLCGLDPTGIGKAPFVPNSLFGTIMDAAKLGLCTAPDATVYLSRCISGYVGGDISLGAMYTQLSQKDKPCIYLDIGTNGEMIIADKSGLCCCATAAGPAFEGAHIKHGTGGIFGAICKAWVENGTLCIETIGNAPAVGICGSGLVDLIAALLELNVLDETGCFLDRDEAPESLQSRYLDGDEVEFIVDPCSGITLTQQDIRQIQLAKSAISAGIFTLLHERALAPDAIDKVYLAGGFGSFINPQSACRIGLIPPVFADRIEVVGNTAGAGAIATLLNTDTRAQTNALAADCAYVELSGHPFFNEQYIENMCF